jgi:hypothetical protein
MCHPRTVARVHEGSRSSSAKAGRTLIIPDTKTALSATDVAIRLKMDAFRSINRFSFHARDCATSALNGTPSASQFSFHSRAAAPSLEDSLSPKGSKQSSWRSCPESPRGRPSARRSLVTYFNLAAINSEKRRLTKKRAQQ